MRKVLLPFLFVAVSLTSFAQTQDHEDVKLTLVTLFDGMREGDSAMVHSTFFDEASMYSTYTGKDGKPALHHGKLQDFLNAIGTPHEQVWNEKLLTNEVQVDGNLAQAWTEYEFYLDEQLLHCGVNSFQLVKLDDSWKIMHLIDTRKGDCKQ